jgi:hypothetical protein
MPLTGPVTICGHLGQQLTHRMGTRCVEKRETKVHLVQLRAKAPVDTLSLHEMLSTLNSTHLKLEERAQTIATPDVRCQAGKK